MSPLRLPLLALLVAAAQLGAAASSAGECRQALALGLDVSGSVNTAEYRLQIDGLAAALSHPDVAGVILSNPDAPIRLLIYEWSGPQDQRLIQDWTEITDPAALAAVTARLRATPRISANPATALGTAITYGAAHLASQSDCLKHTLDISGDGRSNAGPRPEDVADQPVLDNITVNALVIGSDGPDGGVRSGDLGELESYFRSQVIRGPRAFVLTTTGFADYETAMIRKLLREVEGLAVSALERPAPVYQ